MKVSRNELRKIIKEEFESFISDRLDEDELYFINDLVNEFTQKAIDNKFAKFAVNAAAKDLEQELKKILTSSTVPFEELPKSDTMKQINNAIGSHFATLNTVPLI